jgi:hypothetical protein
MKLWVVVVSLLGERDREEEGKGDDWGMLTL